ncbi:MAG: dual specificity protein phosphatase family protein [Elusimicrobia bacterium]|nr:dual specificity protein phosphatase family protein [Elusimicrobiota bacterium]
MSRSVTQSNHRAAAFSAVGLSLLFLLVYGAGNHFASTRPDLGALYLPWEHRFPFWSWMILPYMSIDLFFFGGPFLCRDVQERQVLSGRIVLAILVAGIFFFGLPMRYAFARLVPDDWTREIFRFLHGFDAPHNLFPSLHIALRTILADLYARRTQGHWRWASHVWFSLVGFSTLFTHQHHLPDILAGFVLAAFCFYAIPARKPEISVSSNNRVGTFYAIGATLAWGLAALLPPWGLWFLWPAISLTLMTAAYFSLGSSVFRKTNGQLPFSSRLVLGPVLLGQWISWLYYKRQARPWDEVVPGLLVGRQLTEVEAEQATQEGVKAVLDLTGEFSAPRAFRNQAYLNVPVLDLTAPTPMQLKTACDFIEKHLRSGTVYVHCKIGFSRSVAVVGSFLIRTGVSAHFRNAVDRIRASRNAVVVRPEIWDLFSKQDLL